MTKKSASRILRDGKKKEVKEYLNNNSVFDELNSIHSKIVEQVKSFGMISALSNNMELIERLENKDSVNQSISLMAVDLQKIIGDINQNYSFHKDKTGGATDPDEYMLALTAFQNYSQIAGIVESVILPTVGDIFDAFKKAELKLIEDNKNQEPQAEPV